eukprot:1154137_1
MLKLTVFILITLSCHSTSHSSFQQVNPQCQPNEPTSDTCTDDVNRLGLTRGAFVDKLLPLAPRVCINNTVANALPIISRSTATPIQIDHSTPPQVDSALPIMTTSHSSFQKVNPQCQPNEPISDTCTDDVNRLGLTRGAFVSSVANALPIMPRSRTSNGLLHPKGPAFHHNQASMPFTDAVHNTLPIIPRSTGTPIQIDHFALICSDLHPNGTHFMHSTWMGPPLYHNQAPIPIINTVDSALPIMTRDHLTPFQCTNSNGRFHLKDMSQTIYKHGEMIGVLFMFLFSIQSPMSSFNLLLAIAFHSFTTARSQHLNCTVDCPYHFDVNGSVVFDPCPNGCQFQDLKCNDTATGDCIVDCTGQLSCVGSSIYADAGEGDLFVNCHGRVACVTITISGGTANMSVDCRGEGACSAGTINGAKQNTFVICNGTRACSSATINGTAVTGDMFVDCLGDYACQEATINGAKQNTFVICHEWRVCYMSAIRGGTGNMSVDCRDDYACAEATINGAEQNTFVICNGMAACFLTTTSGGAGNMSFDCRAESACQEATINCAIQNTFVICNGTEACYETTINGTAVTGDIVVGCFGYACVASKVTGGNQNTFINCNGDATCVFATMDGGKGNTYLQCSGENSCRETAISCHSAKYCNITSQGFLSLAGAHIEAGVGSKLYINASGSFGLVQTEIICPTDRIAGSEYTNNSICRIHAHGDSVLSETIIYAVEAYYNVEIECNRDNEYSCYDIDTVDSNPLLYCTEDLNVSCSMEQSPNGGVFSDEDCLCADYLLPTTPPTINPTMMPTTFAPTFSPTQYDPAGQSPRTLYLSKNGCDVGVCDTEAFDWNGHCAFDWFTALEGYNTCCSNLVPITSTKSDTPIQNCDQNFTINNTGIFKEDTAWGVDSELYILCFDVVESLVCYHPTITKILYEEIDYINDNQHYLNIGYNNESNLVNVPFCRGGISRHCGSMRDCPVAMGLVDISWTASEGPYAFYLMNGPGVEPLCGESFFKRNMFVGFTVQCSDFKRSSTCRSFNYVWSCLRGEVNCTEYDGHGAIKIDVGQYKFDDTINIVDKQIRIVGEGYDKTTLTHHTADTIPMIDCHFRQCYITLSDISYNLTSPTMNIIKTTNGGNIKFENVHFVSSAKISFVFTHASQVSFSNCTFTEQIATWNITNSANVSFTHCTFKRIDANQTHRGYSMFNVQNALLSISHSAFEENHNFYAIIRSAHGSTVSIMHSIFRENRNNTYIWHCDNSNASLLNIQYSGANECAQNQCLLFLESDLLVDPISSSTVVFGHTSNTTNQSNTLHASSFTPSSVLLFAERDFLNFGMNNDTIIFEPCVPFDAYSIAQTEFADIASSLPATSTFDSPSETYQQTHTCVSHALCYIECITSPLPCFKSHFIANKSRISLFKCSSSSSCSDSQIHISDSQTAAIVCDGSFACAQIMVNLNNTNAFYFECLQTDSCNEAEIHITNTSNTIIKCYGVGSCNGLRIFSDTNDIDISLLSFNEDIIVNVPSEFIKEKLHCAADNQYLILDTASYIHLNTSLYDLFGGGMPCQNVMYRFDEADKIDCEIRYQFFSSKAIDEELLSLIHGGYDMECYSDIFVDNIVDYTCFGTANPTIDPTVNPTVDPTIDPTVDPTTDPTVHPTIDPTIDPTVDPTINPTVGP